jgi:hypothetical protein
MLIGAMRSAATWGLIAIVLAAGCSNAPDLAIDLAVPDAGSALPDASFIDAAPIDAAPDPGCLSGMVRIENFCVDRFEAHVVEVDSQGNEHPHSPFDIVDNLTVRAVASGGVMPQGYISQVQAADACRLAGKRLCSATEFALACRGPDATNYYPYGGTVRQPGYCNEGKGSSMPIFFGNDYTKWTYANFNDPRLNQWDGGLAPTGSYPRCVSPEGVYDCVGNLHEWGSDPPDTLNHGKFRGGFYGDAEQHGHGCLYVTSAHAVSYHDYSTGFRCCMDAL